MASLFNTWLVSGCEEKLFSLYLSWIRGRLPETLKALLQQLSLKTYQRWFLCYLSQSSFKIFINTFPFLYVKANSRKFVKKYPLLFFRKMLSDYVKKKDLSEGHFFRLHNHEIRILREVHSCDQFLMPDSQNDGFLFTIIEHWKHTTPLLALAPNLV